ncbi:MBL fold metallo-hydrolase [Palleronia sp. LCG004]|uniref:MBL fold metallo-hydrolase n=1 Tax=Palleronia sp. LCG004 TaxID=3079304 RepID=UPI0029436E27|nr:MBL fold metallo-hydrolase [Palleronia sp. LCG004]WOI56573.1 MBL fold metallo-hydrolase [Palleronia sp. LCG004]
MTQMLEPGLRLLRAPNPSPMTHTGTNTYLLGQGPVAVIDPGPGDPAHLDAILAATGGQVSHIFVTHAHLDHAALAPALAAATGAPVLAFGDARAGRSEVMQRMADAGGGEGVDRDFRPDWHLADGEAVTGPDWTLTALWTPGHFCNHLSFAWGDALFTGDLVMGWASSLVSPPDGDLTQFMSSCRRLATGRWRRFHPGHGDPIDDPKRRLHWLISHRQEREAQILDCLADGPARPGELVSRIYTGIEPHLLPAAERNVLAHLVDLTVRGLVRPEPDLGPTALFQKR